VKALDLLILNISNMIMVEKRPKVGSAVLVEKEGSFLLGKRDKPNYRGYWVVPGGGVRWGETIQEAAAREIREETGLDIELVKLIGHKEVFNLAEDYHTVVFFHLARPVRGELNPSGDISDAGFFSIEQIQHMDNVAESAVWALKQAGFWK
jgi:8-oxo-dGTP diphosphatase